jgi:hypothetical protein
VSHSGDSEIQGAPAPDTSVRCNYAPSKRQVEGSLRRGLLFEKASQVLDAGELLIRDHHGRAAIAAELESGAHS